MRLASALLAAALAAPAALPLSAQTLPTAVLGTFANVRNSTGFLDTTPSFPVLKGEVYFSADGGDGAGAELWRTDGTAAGTVRVSDINPGSGSSDPLGFVVFRGYLYFNASNGTSSALYRTDGVNGVTMFAPYPVGVMQATSIGLFGTATNVVASAGTEPWVTDGTTYGMLKNINTVNGAHGTPGRTQNGSFTFTERGSTVFFAANDGSSQEGQLWKTLGTEASTERVMIPRVASGYPSFCQSPYVEGPGDMFVLGGTLHFTATWYTKGSPPPGQNRDACFVTGLDQGYIGALWTSTGSPGDVNATRALASTLGTRADRVWVDRASERREASASGRLGSAQIVEGRGELVSGDIVYAGPPSLYAFNGSSLTPLFAGEYAAGNGAFVKMGVLGDRLVFGRMRRNPNNPDLNVGDVMVTDGTPSGTSVLGTFDRGLRQGVVSDGYAYFVPNSPLDASLRQVHRTDGTAAPAAATNLTRAVSHGFTVESALPGGVLALDVNYNVANGYTLYGVGTPGQRVIRQPLSGTGTASQTLSDGTASIGVTFDVQSIAGSGEMRLQLLNHTADPLADGAPTTGVLRRYVRIERPTSISAIETSLTLSYTDDDLAAAGIADESVLVVWKYSEGVWTRLVPSSRNTADNTITLAGITSFSDFAIADNAASLPVELAAFTAAADGSTARLAWATASETNNAGFAVEHRQGQTWVERGFVAGHGTTTERHDYAFDVTGLTAGTHTFRLRQTDTDGTIHYSAQVSVEIRVGTGIDEEGRAGMRLTVLGGRAVRVETNAPANVTAYDVLGRQVLTQSVASGTTDVSFAGMSTGMYLVRAEHDGVATTTRIVVR